MPHTNRLARETSPYLLQHAHNPVDWYAWGPEAFEASRTQNKPIFLSVGYSTCYWCHVMERQSFEIESIAKEMNERFINIKVDREERPDVDQLYMTAVQILTRQGGWPMSVFLLPDLRPFYGGTYFPPTDSFGRPGFVSVLKAIDDAYKNRRSDVERSAVQLLDILNQLAEPVAPSQKISIDADFIRQLINRSTSDYDSVHGGFGTAPKFPRETLLELLLTADQSQIARPAGGYPESQIRHSLDAMANGGIRDHLGGGFHRYSTDEQWLVPHFEIMLYDNAMLGWCYVEAFRQSKEPRYARIARGIFDFILREMTSPGGGFYTAFDAEVDAMEGLSYLWTMDEIESVLGKPEALLFSKVYGVDQGPNFVDPHHGNGVPDKSILHLPDGPAMEDDPGIVAMRQKLLGARAKRKQPLLDTKIITSWNALMIRALAHGGNVLQESRYTAAAEKAATFLLREHRAADGSLHRTSRDGVKKHPGFLDDYSFTAQALLALGWKDHAADIARVMQDRFGDEQGGFFFTAADAADLIVRQKVASDSPLPSGNAVAAMVMLQLGQPEIARKTISVFARQLEQQGEGMSAMVQAADAYVRQVGNLDVEPSTSADADRPLSPAELAQRIVGVGSAWLDAKRLELRLQILRPFHINSNHPPSGLIATELRAQNAAIESIDYPPGDTWNGQVSLLVHFAQPIVAEVAFSLTYQPCNESECLMAVTKPFSVPPAPSAGSK